MRNTSVVRNYYVLPCCLLLLNLCVELVSYKARMFGDPYLRTAAIMGMVLFGGSLVGFVVAPAIGAMVTTLQREAGMARDGWGRFYSSWSSAPGYSGCITASTSSARSRCSRGNGTIRSCIGE